MKPFTLSKPYILSQKLSLIFYIIIILTTVALSILSPYIIGDFLDVLIEGGEISVVIRFALLFGGLGVFKILLGYITTMIYTRVQTKMSYDFNINTIKHIQGLSLSYMNKHGNAYLSQRLGSDTYSLISFCISILQNILTNVIMLIVPFIILINMNWFIAVLMGAFLIIYTSLYIIFKKPLYRSNFSFKEAQANFFSKLFDQLKFVKFIKINSVQQQMNKKAEDSFEEFRGAVVHNTRVNYAYSGLDGFVSTIAQIALFVIGGIQILNGNFTIGMFTVFTSYFGMMLGAIRYFFGLGASYQNVMVSYNRVREILNQKPESVGVKVISDISKIELKDVIFSYLSFGEATSYSDEFVKEATKDIASRANNCVSDLKEKVVLANFNTVFSKGKMYAVKGANGTGKSTLINLIMGLYVDEYSGHITYNYIDIRQIDMVHARRSLIGFSEQEPLLLNDSIWHNLCFGSDQFQNQSKDKSYKDCAKLNKYIKVLGMETFINKNSMDFVINDESTNTSGGEKQKISILKVLYKNPDVMIFDEPTSALDIHSTRRFTEYLTKIKKDKIIIIITHDKAVSSVCDEIVSLG